MNIPLMLKHFPELRALPEERQEAVLREAHERAYSPEHKLRHWRRNMVSLVWITAIALFLTLVARPALGLSGGAMGAIIMFLVLPVYMYQRHRLYVSELRPQVRAILASQGDDR